MEKPPSLRPEPTGRRRASSAGGDDRNKDLETFRKQNDPTKPLDIARNISKYALHNGYASDETELAAKYRSGYEADHKPKPKLVGRAGEARQISPVSSKAPAGFDARAESEDRTNEGSTSKHTAFDAKTDHIATAANHDSDVNDVIPDDSGEKQILSKADHLFLS